MENIPAARDRRVERSGEYPIFARPAVGIEREPS
jgi:hypothetical protein